MSVLQAYEAGYFNTGVVAIPNLQAVLASGNEAGDQAIGGVLSLNGTDPSGLSIVNTQGLSLVGSSSNGTGYINYSTPLTAAYLNSSVLPTLLEFQIGYTTVVTYPEFSVSGGPTVAGAYTFPNAGVFLCVLNSTVLATGNYNTAYTFAGIGTVTTYCQSSVSGYATGTDNWFGLGSGSSIIIVPNSNVQPYIPTILTSYAQGSNTNPATFNLSLSITRIA